MFCKNMNYYSNHIIFCYFFTFRCQIYLSFQIKNGIFASKMELGRHIEFLLLENDCVIVPGLGGFIARHISARYDNNDNMFIPPLRTLGFNRQLNINDSLLVQSYAETYDISYPDAYTRIEDEVHELKQYLDNDGYYELIGIGILYVNDGNISFMPYESGILTPSLYSFSSFEMKRITKNIDIKQEKKNLDISKVQYKISSNDKTVFSNEESVVNAQFIDFKNTDNKVYGKVNIIRNFLVTVIAVLLFFVLGTPINNADSFIKTSNIENGIINKIINDGYNNIKKTDVIKFNTEGDKYTNETIKRKQNTINICKNKKKPYFSIVLASRITKKNANIFIHQLKKQGLKDVNILIEKNKTIKVIYGYYQTKKDAYNTLNHLIANQTFYDAWVYKINN